MLPLDVGIECVKDTGLFNNVEGKFDGSGKRGMVARNGELNRPARSGSNETEARPIIDRCSIYLNELVVLSDFVWNLLFVDYRENCGMKHFEWCVLKAKCRRSRRRSEPSQDRLPWDISSSLQSSRCLLALISFVWNSWWTQEIIFSVNGSVPNVWPGARNNLKRNDVFVQSRLVHSPNIIRFHLIID